MSTPVVQGHAAEDCAAIRAAFERCASELGETGGACAVWHRGEWVVDLWTGHIDEAQQTPWQRDTLVHLYSTTKPFAALGLMRLVDDGRVSLDAPVATYWPEFAAAGKAEIPVRYLLTHQAGLMTPRESLPGEALYDWERITRLLAAQEPWWEPGTASGEAAKVFGHLVGEVTQRVTGVPFARWLREQVAAPWQLDFHVALTDAECARCATVVGMSDEWREGLASDPQSLRGRAAYEPHDLLREDVVNSVRWRTACIPAVNGHATARAVARMYGGLVSGGVLDGTRLLSQDTVQEITREQYHGYDHFLMEPARWGLGVQLDVDGFGHGGLGGSLGWADAKTGVGFGYVTHRMGNHDRAIAVWTAVCERFGIPASA